MLLRSNVRQHHDHSLTPAAFYRTRLMLLVFQLRLRPAEVSNGFRSTGPASFDSQQTTAHRRFCIDRSRQNQRENGYVRNAYNAQREVIRQFGAYLSFQLNHQPAMYSLHPRTPPCAPSFAQGCICQVTFFSGLPHLPQRYLKGIPCLHAPQHRCRYQRHWTAAVLANV